MPRIKYQQHHSLAPDEARRRLQELMERFGQKYGFRTSWVGDSSVDVKGRGVSGSMTVREREVLVDLNLSLLLAPFRSKIQDGIARQIEQALQP